MKMARWSMAIWALLCLLILFPVTAGAYVTAPPECYSSQPPSVQSQIGSVWIVPQAPRPSDTITVCGIGTNWPEIPANSSVMRDGNKITATVLVSGISSAPNPPIMVGAQVGTLSPGSYSIELFNFQPNNLHPEYSYTYLIGSLSFDVASSNTIGVPATNFGSLLLLIALVGLSAVFACARLRVTRLF